MSLSNRYVIAALAALACAGSPLRAETLQVLQDTTGSPARNEIKASAGGAATLRISPKDTALLQFDLAGSGIAAADVTAARLTLYVAKVASPGTVSLYANTSAFAETLATPTIPMPSRAGAPLAAIALTRERSRQFVTVDVTSQVQAWLAGTSPDFGIALASDGAVSVLLGSKETRGGAYPAVLEIDVTPTTRPVKGTDATFTGSVTASSVRLPPTSDGATGVVTQNGVPVLHSFGTSNFFAGPFAGNFTMTGSSNTAVGWVTLTDATTGSGNVSMGEFALRFSKDGAHNVAIGAYSQVNVVSGSGNTAVGYYTLVDNQGTLNVAIGDGAGQNLTTGNNNIDIANPGVAGESSTTRIGTNGLHLQVYVAGISGATSSGGAAVFVNAAGKLGTQTSSRRFKDDIRDMGAASATLLALRPVTFRYKPEIDAAGIPQFGLVAEEVEALDPALVVRDGEGRVQSVRYEQVNAMLLNEFLKDHRRLSLLETRLAGEVAALRTSATEKDAEIAALREKLAQQTAQEASRSAAHEARLAALEDALRGVAADRAARPASGIETATPR